MSNYNCIDNLYGSIDHLNASECKKITSYDRTKKLFLLQGGQLTSLIDRFLYLANSFVSRLLPASWTKHKDSKNKRRYGAKTDAATKSGRNKSRTVSHNAVESVASNRLQKVIIDCCIYD